MKIAFIGFLLLLSVQAAIANAQGPVPRYSPPNSPISPYMNYFIGPDPLVLDRYNAYVRPSLQLQQTERRQSARIQQLNGELGQLNGQVGQLRRSTTSPTGIGGGFFNYSHYYTMPGAPRR